MKANLKKNIVVIDLSVKSTSPAGSCVLSQLEGLQDTYDIDLFTNEVDQKLEKKINCHIINAPSTPLILRYIVFCAGAKKKVDALLNQLPLETIVQSTQGQFIKCDISYPHFCHRAYLKKQWKKSAITGLRRISRKWNHLYHAKMEAKAFDNAKVIIVPSHGLKREIVEFYPNNAFKIKVIANPVDVSYFRKPTDFDAKTNREHLGIATDDIVISFAALGDFARKGLPELMKALALASKEFEKFKIVVIGGKPLEINIYKKKALELGITEKVCFVGFQTDIRPYLWMSDIFALPSLYEIFPLVCIQAAAGGIPLLVTKMHGVEEYIDNGKNGWLIERNPQSIAAVLLAVSHKEYNLEAMGDFALQTIMQYDHESFRKKWLEVYESLSQDNEVV